MARAKRELPPAPPLYEADFYGWALAQAALLRERRLGELDVGNVIEELEGLARGEARELRHRYGTLLAHLLKWELQPDQRSYSWVGTIGRERREIGKHLRDNPGLKPRREELFADAFDTARDTAVEEAGLPPEHFPPENPYTLEQATDPDFWPGGREMPARARRGRRRA